MDNLIINDNLPIFCIIKHLYQEKNSNNQEIKEWLETHYDSKICNQIKSKAKELLEQQKLFFEQNDELSENRIILEFKHSENKQKKYDVYIHNFRNGKFVANKEPIYFEKDIEDEQFQKEIVQNLYNNADMSDKHLDILLPKSILLTDIKQWSASQRVRLTKRFSVNIHLRERAVIKNKKAYIDMWDEKSKQFKNHIKQALKPMESEDDEVTKDTTEAGLMYLYQPKCIDTFYDDMLFSLISIRCTDSEKFELYKQW